MRADALVFVFMCSRMRCIATDSEKDLKNEAAIAIAAELKTNTVRSLPPRPILSFCL